MGWSKAVTEDIRTLTARIADEPGTLAFLELGETLRGRGQLDAALKVARGGLMRHPQLASAHDLLARILCDRDDLPGAFEAWADTLRVDPMHVAALKGIAFLYYRAGDIDAARQHLVRALEADPDDPTIPSALARVSAGATPMPRLDAAAATVAAAPESAAPERQDIDVLLVDGSGMRLRGKLTASDRDVSDAVAAQLAGVSKEATRTARLLELGVWENLAVESPDGHLVLIAPTPDTILLASHNADMPMARLTLLADRAAREAGVWLERER
jgi:tetratricopeptide (TPR) repeat protein